MFFNSICSNIGDMFVKLWNSTGLAQGGFADAWQNYVMIIISFILMYLAIVKKFEPLLLLPIAFGMFIINIPGAREVLWGEEIPGSETHEVVKGEEGLIWYLFRGVEWVIYPPIIFLGIGVMTDFGPLIANPKSMLMGAAAQLGVFLTFLGATLIPEFELFGTQIGFTLQEAGAIAIIGGADGPTAIYVAQELAPQLLSSIAIAAYSYMALIPVIQKPIMRALTTKKERSIKMEQLRKVSKVEKIVFPLVVCLVVGLLLPSAMPLLGMLMLGNLMRESGVVGRLTDTAQNGLMNTITIFLGVCVGTKAYGAQFLNFGTIFIIVLGLIAFSCGTIGGLLVGKLMCKLSGGKINPLIGSAGVSAVPMAARISQDVGRETDPNNHLLMHAMGPNVAGVIGSAIAAGVLLAICR